MQQFSDAFPVGILFISLQSGIGIDPMANVWP